VIVIAPTNDPVVVGLNVTVTSMKPAGPIAPDVLSMLKPAGRDIALTVNVELPLFSTLKPAVIDEPTVVLPKLPVPTIEIIRVAAGVLLPPFPLGVAGLLLPQAAKARQATNANRLGSRIADM
jgi:hypothetical protein